jgi:hypothetical protein
MKKARLRRCKDGDKEYSLVWIWCPGCDEHHPVRVDPGGWTWNGNEESPTISPSILVSGVRGNDTETKTLCHSFVTDGKVQFLSDSTHKLSGQTVDLPEMNL